MSANAIHNLEAALLSHSGGSVGKYFDVRFLRQNRSLCSELSKAVPSLRISELWSEIISDICAIGESDTPMSELEAYVRCSSVFIRDFAKIPTDLSIPCLVQVSKSFRYYAANVDYNESVNHMQKLLKLGLSIKAFSAESSPLLTIVNDLLAAYFMKNLFTQAENLLRSVDNDSRPLDYSQFPDNEVTTYKFNKGKILAIKMELREAKECLVGALDGCPFGETQNRRLILLYLIPVMLALGEVPSTEMLGKYNLDIYDELTKAFVNADLKLYNEGFDKYQFVFIKLGLFELICRLKNIIYYQLFKMVLGRWNDVKVPVAVFQGALKIFTPSVSLLETEAILCSLIDRKLIKAYIYHKAHVIVFSKDTPFLPINESE